MSPIRTIPEPEDMFCGIFHSKLAHGKVRQMILLTFKLLQGGRGLIKSINR